MARASKIKLIAAFTALLCGAVLVAWTAIHSILGGPTTNPSKTLPTTAHPNLATTDVPTRSKTPRSAASPEMASDPLGRLSNQFVMTSGKAAERQLFAERTLPGLGLEWVRLQRTVQASPERDTISQLVDVALYVTEKNWRKNDPQSSYQLLQYVLDQLDSMASRVPDPDAMKVERTRLLIAVSRMNRAWGGIFPGIPKFDGVQARRYLDEITHCNPQDPISAYRRQEILMDAQAVFSGSMTDGSSLSSLINAPPATRSPWEQCMVVSTKSNAFFKRAQLIGSEGKENVRVKAILLQYAIDTAAGMPSDSSDHLSVLDRQLLQQMRSQAEAELKQTRDKAMALGIDLDAVLSGRLSVATYQVN